MGLFDSLLGPISEVAGKIFQGNRDYKHQREIMDTNMMFQERMSSTAFQRATADMEAAGLNPMLAYQQGGSSSPPGSTGGSPAPSRAGDAIAGGISSAMALKRNNAEVDLLKAQKEKVEAETPGAEAQSSILQKTWDSVSPYIQMNTQNEAYILAAATDIARWELSYEEKRLRLAERLLDMNLDAEARLRVADAALAEVELRYRKLSGPQLEAESRAWRTGYGQNVRPYLGDAAKAVGAASTAVGGYFLGKGVSAVRAAREGAARLGGGYRGPRGEGPAVWRARSRRQDTESGYQMTRPLPGPQDR